MLACVGRLRFFGLEQALVDAQRRGEADPLWLQKELEAGEL